MIGFVRQRIVDQVMDAYVDWREECDRVWEAYALWSRGGNAATAHAFRTYVAALDREEEASQVYARLVASHR